MERPTELVTDSPGAGAPPPGDSAPSGASLRKVALGGGRLGAISAATSQLLSILTTVVLVRLLTPHDIGVVASATIVIGLFEILVEVGLGAGLVQRPEVDARVLSTTFWTSMALGAVLAALGSATSPLSASLIGNPGVAPYIAAVSVITAVTFASVVPTAILQRDLRYGAMYGAKISAVVVYSVTAVAVAGLTDLGAWSIIVGRFAQVLTEWLWVTLATRWRPTLEFDSDQVRRGVRFNAGYWGNTCTAYASKNADYWTVGRRSGSGALGVYYIAYVLPNVVRQRMTTVAQDVLFPLMARIGADRERLANGYVRTARLVAFVAYPVLLGIAALSERIIHLFFGPDWSGAVAPMTVLAVAAAVDVLSQLANVLFLARGEPGRSLAVNAVRLGVLLAGLVVAALVGGLTPIAFAVLASSLAAATYAQWQATRKLGITVPRVVGAVLPMAAAAGVMVAAVRAADLAVGGRPASVPALVALVGLGGAAYAACGLVLFRRLFLSLLGDLREMAVPGRRRARAADGPGRA